MKLCLVVALLVPSVALAQVEVVESGPENEVTLEVIESDQPAEAPAAYAPPAQPVQPVQAVQPAGYTPQAQVLDERLELDQALDAYPIGGSIAMTAIGVGLGLVFSAGAWLVKNASGVARCVDDLGGVDDDDCGTTNTTGTAVMGSIAAAAFTIGIIGFIRLVVRVSKRARIRRDFRQSRGVSFDADSLSLRF